MAPVGERPPGAHHRNEPGTHLLQLDQLPRVGRWRMDGWLPAELRAHPARPGEARMQNVARLCPLPRGRDVSKRPPWEVGPVLCAPVAACSYPPAVTAQHKAPIERGGTGGADPAVPRLLGGSAPGAERARTEAGCGDGHEMEEQGGCKSRRRWGRLHSRTTSPPSAFQQGHQQPPPCVPGSAPARPRSAGRPRPIARQSTPWSLWHAPAPCVPTARRLRPAVTGSRMGSAGTTQPRGSKPYPGAGILHSRPHACPGPSSPSHPPRTSLTAAHLRLGARILSSACGLHRAGPRRTGGTGGLRGQRRAAPACAGEAALRHRAAPPAAASLLLRLLFLVPASILPSRSIPPSLRQRSPSPGASAGSNPTSCPQSTFTLSLPLLS